MVTIQIWTNRLLKEFDRIESRLPSGVSLSSHTMDAETGVCRAVFDAALTAPANSSLSVEKGDAAEVERGADVDAEDGGDGATEDSQAPEDANKLEGEVETAADDTHAAGEGKIDGEAEQALNDGDGTQRDGRAKDVREQLSPLAFKIEMDMSLDTRYPFESPVIRVLEGSEVIPTDLLAGDVVVLPDSDSWTPSNTIIATLQDISDMVIHAREAGLPTGEGDGSRALERGDLRPGSLVSIEALGGCLFPCTPPPTPLFSTSIMSPLSRRPLDRYVGVTDRQVLELEAHRTRLNQAVVISAIDMRMLSKLKFRRGASVTLVLRGGEEKEFLTPQSHECVVTVTERLHKMGIAGHQTSAGAEKQVDRAKSIMASLQLKERELETAQSLDLVEECMDLFRQAAELFSAAEDPRHEQVVGHMHRFLQRPAVVALLEGNTPPAAVNPTDADGVGSPARAAVAGSVPRGEVLPRTPPLPSTEDSGGEDDDDDSVGREENSVEEGGGALGELQKMLEDSGARTPAINSSRGDVVSNDSGTGTLGKQSAGKTSTSTEPQKTPASKTDTPAPSSSSTADKAPGKKQPLPSSTRSKQPLQQSGAAGTGGRVVAAGLSARSPSAKSTATDNLSPTKESATSGSRGRGRGRGSRGGAPRGARSSGNRGGKLSGTS